MYELVYHSIAKPGITNIDIADILIISRARNKDNDVTGCLIFFDGRFIQILEGDEVAVREIYASIEKDHRHFKVTLLYHGTKKNRDFNDWNMGYFKGENSKMQSKFNLDKKLLDENSETTIKTVKGFWKDIKPIME
ncbi:BLUF domain-containing protein [Ekhidna sp.]|uniref:BLUF domain-containing protein n=1 Tax=Ekhidna sp. TaxID=2608089 RepID=UPI003517418E